MSAARATISIRKALAARRLSLGMSMAAVGARMGVTGQQIGRYESGENMPPITRLIVWAEVLGLSVTLTENQPDERRAFDTQMRPACTMEGQNA